MTKNLENINSDLVKYLAYAGILTDRDSEQFAELPPEDFNCQLIEFLRNYKDSSQVSDALGMAIAESDVLPDEKALKYCKEMFERNNFVLPIHLSDEKLIIATVDPFDLELFESVEQRLGKTIEWQLTSFQDIEKCRNKNIQTSVLTMPVNAHRPASGGSTDFFIEHDLDNFFENLISQASIHRASDIHLENYRDKMVIRFRIDGKLMVFSTVDKLFAQAVVATIKN